MSATSLRRLFDLLNRPNCWGNYCDAFPETFSAGNALGTSDVGLRRCEIHLKESVTSVSANFLRPFGAEFSKVKEVVKRFVSIHAMVKFSVSGLGYDPNLGQAILNVKLEVGSCEQTRGRLSLYNSMIHEVS